MLPWLLLYMLFLATVLGASRAGPPWPWLNIWVPWLAGPKPSEV